MANGYPQPPPYDSHDDFNDIDNSVFETEEQAEENVSRSRYKKKEDKKKLVGGRDRSASASSVKLQLNRLSEKEVADATMANVFGKDETQVATTSNKRNSSAMKVNPLYDQNGAVEVSTNEAHRIRSGSVGSVHSLGDTQDYDDGSSSNNRQSKYNTTSKPYKKSKKKTNDDDEGDDSGRPEPKIAYSKNFRFKGPAKQNGHAKGGPKKLTTGRIMPSRISRNAIPGSQIMASLAGKERPKPVEYKEPPSNERHPDDVEAVVRRSEMRKKWRLLIALILIILIFSLILVVVLLFATKAA